MKENSKETRIGMIPEDWEVKGQMEEGQKLDEGIKKEIGRIGFEV